RALSDYNQWQQGESTLTHTLADGAAAIPMPQGTLMVVRVIGPGGQEVPRRTASANGTEAGTALAWEWWGGEVRLTGEIPAGEYEVRYHAERALPSIDAEALPIRDGDVPLL